MSEKRDRKRKRPIYYLKLINQKTQNLAGGVIDISPSGIKLSGTEPYQFDSLTNFSLSLPDAIEGEKQITVIARNIWSKRDTRGDFYDYYTSGFRLEEITTDDVNTIEGSLKSYLFEG
ncbi:MAG: PilZ domain-containing protein [candidate division Zixibacteria bacterium]|nr:PilZ domain-containing protein [candidate division Zixibacteria bacterium]